MKKVSPIFYGLLALLLASCQSIKTSNDSSGVERRYAPEKDFTRISEYFTGEENTSGRLYLRSQPDEREGYYWIVSTPESLRSEPGRVTLEAHIPGSPETRLESFEVKTFNEQSIWVGMTGSDWPSSKARPVAWQLTVYDRQGAAVFQRESFLWSEPRSSEK